jgi:hypothetical protein
MCGRYKLSTPALNRLLAQFAAEEAGAIDYRPRSASRQHCAMSSTRPCKVRFNNCNSTGTRRFDFRDEFFGAHGLDYFDDTTIWRVGLKKRTFFETPDLRAAFSRAGGVVSKGIPEKP